MPKPCPCPLHRIGSGIGESATQLHTSLTRGLEMRDWKSKYFSSGDRLVLDVSCSRTSSFLKPKDYRSRKSMKCTMPELSRGGLQTGLQRLITGRQSKGKAALRILRKRMMDLQIPRTRDRRCNLSPCASMAVAHLCYEQ